jgi:hypothetical protein
VLVGRLSISGIDAQSKNKSHRIERPRHRPPHRPTRRDRTTAIRQKLTLTFPRSRSNKVTSQKFGHGREVGWPMQRIPDDFELGQRFLGLNHIMPPRRVCRKGLFDWGFFRACKATENFGQGCVGGGRGTGSQHSIPGIRSSTYDHGEGTQITTKRRRIAQKIRRSAGAAKALSGNTPGSNDPLVNEQRTQFARLEYFSS